MTGDEYYVVSPMIPGYEADMEVLEGIISKDMIVRVKYKRTRQKLEIRYVTLDGMPAAETYTQELLSGVSYKVNSPEIPGYTTARPSVTGVMGGTDVTHIVVYIPEEYTDEDVTGSGSVFSIDDYETPLGLGQAFMQMGICVE